MRWDEDFLPRDQKMFMPGRKDVDSSRRQMHARRYFGLGRAAESLRVRLSSGHSATGLRIRHARMKERENFTCGSQRRKREGPDYALPVRQAPGARPISRVNAREKVDSDS